MFWNPSERTDINSELQVYRLDSSVTKTGSLRMIHKLKHHLRDMSLTVQPQPQSWQLTACADIGRGGWALFSTVYVLTNELRPLLLTPTFISSLLLPWGNGCFYQSHCLCGALLQFLWSLISIWECMAGIVHWANISYGHERHEVPGKVRILHCQLKHWKVEFVSHKATTELSLQRQKTMFRH